MTGILDPYEGYNENVRCCRTCKFYSCFSEEQFESCSCPKNKGRFSEICAYGVCNHYRRGKSECF